MQIDLCVKVFLHRFEKFLTTLGLLAVDDDKHEIRHADCNEPDKMHHAHTDRIERAEAPERKHAEHYQRDCKIYAGAMVLVAFDNFVVHVFVAHNVARIAVSHTEILHPTVAQGLRSFCGETTHGKLADVVVVYFFNGFKIFSDFFACACKFESA